MTKTTTLKCLLFNLCLLLSMQSFAQELLDVGESQAEDSISNTLLRSKNAIYLGGGSSLINGDISNLDFENYFELKLKRFISPNIAINGNVKKFDIENFDFKEEGYLSGDLNVEWYILPEEKFSPYIFAGPGILTSNNFKDQNYKVQGGFGLEYLITNCIAVAGTLEANYIYDEQNGSQLLQEADNLYYNVSVGVQFYFGNDSKSKSTKAKLPKKKLSENESTVINSNLIGQYQKFIKILDLMP